MICITDPHLLAYAQEHFSEILTGRFEVGCQTLNITGISTTECIETIRRAHERCRCDGRRWAILRSIVTLQYAKDFPEDLTSPEHIAKLAKSALN